MKRWILLLFTNILVMVALTLVASLVMTSLGLSFDSHTGLLVFCFIFGMGGSFISLWISKWAAKKMMRLQPADQPALISKIHELARRSGLDQMPEVYIYSSPEVNAFATGPSRNNSLVAVSTGLMERLNSDELEAVLAHEVGHIANGDMVTMTLVQGVVNSLAMFVAYIVSAIIMNALRSNDDEHSGGIGDFFLYYIIHSFVHMVVSFLALPLIMAVSRWREYRADAHSGRLVGKHKMIAALEALKVNYENLEKHDKSVEVMSISGRSSFMELFSSHPPLDKRIKALQGCL